MVKVPPERYPELNPRGGRARRSERFARALFLDAPPAPA